MRDNYVNAVVAIACKQRWKTSRLFKAMLDLSGSHVAFPECGFSFEL